MPRKPTQPYGYINFAKDGKVTKHVTTLPDSKEEQEGKVIESFVASLRQQGKIFEVERLPEDDNDFMLRSTNSEVDVLLEMVELVGRECLTEATEEYKNSPNPRFRNWVYLGPDKIYGVDEDAKANTIKKLIENKISKSYAKPEGSEFWLLIWTVQFDHIYEWWEGGKKHLSDAVLVASEYLEKYGSSPFDQIWVYHPQFNPRKIWPTGKG